jgi:hypothetical protein
MATVLIAGGDWAHYDAHGRNPHAIAAQDNVLLSKSPMPEFWCRCQKTFRLCQ